MAEGGRHLAPDPGGSQSTPQSGRPAAEEMDWQEEPPQPDRRRTGSGREQARAQAAPRRQPVREEMDWQEERTDPRRTGGQSTTRSRQSAPPRRSSQQTYTNANPGARSPASPQASGRRQQTPPSQPRRTAGADLPSAQGRRRTSAETVSPGPASRRPGRERGNTPPPRRRQPQEQSYGQPPARPARIREERVYPDGRQQPQRARARTEPPPPRYEDPEPWRKKGRRGGGQKQNLPLILLVIVLVCGVLFAGGKLMGIMLDYRRDRTAYNSLAEQALAGMVEPDATPDPNAQQQTEQDDQAQSASTVDWEYLRGVNGDVIGWLYCPDTPINYPVVQTGDNDFYLHRSFWDKQENTSGTLFADSVCNIGSDYSNFIIYGHNMKDGSMFASLQKYVDAAYYSEHPAIYFFTPEGDYRVELIGARIVESTMTNYPYYFSGNMEYQTYLNDITSHSYFSTHATVSTDYQLMTLSTCDYSGNYYDPRFLVQGLMVPVTS